ncbi:MAG: hypothetical protein WD512_15385 [Candidatus Paceibacterota bacterium]
MKSSPYLDKIPIFKIEDSREKNLFTDEQTFKELENPIKGYEEESPLDELSDAYKNLVEILKKWMDLKEEYYKIIALWIIGTYFHHNFPSYPYLFFNATKGSGKTRTLRLITYLSKNGEMLNSLTEAVLFRTKGTLAIDEFEGINRKGRENLIELLNSAYKKGIKVKRMKKSVTKSGEEQVPEEFEVYRPILLANITGMESVLGDRCITLTLEKSPKTEVINLVEIFDQDFLIQETKKLLERITSELSGKCRLCRVVTMFNVYSRWNAYINTNTTNYIKDRNTTNDILPFQLFEKVKLSGINGRELELGFPLFIISNEVNDLDEIISTLTSIMKERREDDIIDNLDNSLLDFLSQEVPILSFIPVSEITSKFKEFLQVNEDWLNSKWMGRALKRLVLIKQKRRLGRGREIIINFEKAKEKIKMFK